MKLGASAMFDGRPGREAADVAPFARAAESAGFSTIWIPEHVVFFREYTSQYPYNETGEPGFGRDQGLYDPLFVAQAAALATTTLRVATSVLILPERNPVVLAQEVVALDHFSNGRFDLGVGVGWSSEEFEAIGVPWSRRGARTDDYLVAMKTLWSDEVASHHGEFVQFEGVIAMPKPRQTPHPPIVVGGQSPAALRRVVKHGDAWYGWNLTIEELGSTIEDLRHRLEAADRDPSSVSCKIGIPSAPTPGDVRPYIEQAAELGVDEVVLLVNRRGRPIAERLEEFGTALVGPVA